MDRIAFHGYGLHTGERCAVTLIRAPGPMCFAVAGLVAQGETNILNADCVDISFPTFWEEFEKLRVE